MSVFIAVVEQGSISAAARVLHLSQPAISHHITTLEREIGSPLLERESRGVTATPAGLALIPGARAAIDASAHAVSHARAVAAGSVGVLRIAVVESLVAPLVAPVLRQWSIRRPGVAVELTEVDHANAVDHAVRTRNVDIGIAPRTPNAAGHATLIHREQGLAVLPPGHVLENRPSVSWNELAGERIVHFSPANGLAEWIDGAAAAAGITLDAAVRTRAAVTATALATAGVGIAVVPESAIFASSDDPVVRPLEPPLMRDLAALTVTPSDTLVRAFTADLVTVAQRWQESSSRSRSVN